MDSQTHEKPRAANFTFEYAQPEAYHFCQDSILFAKLVADDLQSRKLGLGGDFSGDFRALDVCAGCGVIGFEIAHRLQQNLGREVLAFDFIEIQNEFAPYFFENIRRTNFSPSTFRFLNENYRELLRAERAQTYDLIVANPPYFFTDEGSSAAHTLKNRARFFIDESFDTLISGIANALRPKGSAYILMKSGENHGRSGLRELRLALAKQVGEEILNFSTELMPDIRGTQVARFTRE